MTIIQVIATMGHFECCNLCLCVLIRSLVTYSYHRTYVYTFLDYLILVCYSCTLQTYIQQVVLCVFIVTTISTFLTITNTYSFAQNFEDVSYWRIKGFGAISVPKPLSLTFSAVNRYHPFPSCLRQLFHKTFSFA